MSTPTGGVAAFERVATVLRESSHDPAGNLFKRCSICAEQAEVVLETPAESLTLNKGDYPTAVALAQHLYTADHTILTLRRDGLARDTTVPFLSRPRGVQAAYLSLARRVIDAARDPEPTPDPQEQTMTNDQTPGTVTVTFTPDVLPFYRSMLDSALEMVPRDDPGIADLRRLVSELTPDPDLPVGVPLLYRDNVGDEAVVYLQKSGNVTRWRNGADHFAQLTEDLRSRLSVLATEPPALTEEQVDAAALEMYEKGLTGWPGALRPGTREQYRNLSRRALRAAGLKLERDQ